VRAGLLDHLLGFAAFVAPSLAAGFFTLLIPLDSAFGFGFFAFFFPYRCIPSSASIGVPSGTNTHTEKHVRRHTQMQWHLRSDRRSA
jgi:hypothetical protein